MGASTATDSAPHFQMGLPRYHQTMSATCLPFSQNVAFPSIDQNHAMTGKSGESGGMLPHFTQSPIARTQQGLNQNHDAQADFGITSQQGFSNRSQQANLNAAQHSTATMYTSNHNAAFEPTTIRQNSGLQTASTSLQQSQATSLNLPYVYGFSNGLLFNQDPTLLSRAAAPMFGTIHSPHTSPYPLASTLSGFQTPVSGQQRNLLPSPALNLHASPFPGHVVTCATQLMPQVYGRWEPPAGIARPLVTDLSRANFAGPAWPGCYRTVTVDNDQAYYTFTDDELNDMLETKELDSMGVDWDVITDELIAAGCPSFDSVNALIASSNENTPGMDSPADMLTQSGLPASTPMTSYSGQTPMAEDVTNQFNSEHTPTQEVDEI